MEQDGSKGFDNLIGTHTEALEENSMMIEKLLEALNKKTKSNDKKDRMSTTDMKALKSIQRSIDMMNKDIDRL